jgi:hypothetical protein
MQSRELQSAITDRASASLANRSSFRRAVFSRVARACNSYSIIASTVMNKFQKLGLIDYNGGIEVDSSLSNVILRDQPQIRN